MSRDESKRQADSDLICSALFQVIQALVEHGMRPSQVAVAMIGCGVRVLSETGHTQLAVSLDAVMRGYESIQDEQRAERERLASEAAAKQLD